MQKSRDIRYCFLQVCKKLAPLEIAFCRFAEDSRRQILLSAGLQKARDVRYCFLQVCGRLATSDIAFCKPAKGSRHQKQLSANLQKAAQTVSKKKTRQEVYARFDIAIAKLGIVTHPYNQVIQEYSEMEELQKDFKALLKVKGGEKTQMIVRVGRAKISYKSWRKDVEDYIMR